MGASDGGFGRFSIAPSEDKATGVVLGQFHDGLRPNAAGTYAEIEILALHSASAPLHSTVGKKETRKRNNKKISRLTTHHQLSPLTQVGDRLLVKLQTRRTADF